MIYASVELIEKQFCKYIVKFACRKWLLPNLLTLSDFQTYIFRRGKCNSAWELYSNFEVSNSAVQNATPLEKNSKKLNNPGWN